MMNRRTVKQNFEWFLIFLFVLIGVAFAAAEALAADDVPGPDDELWVTFGAVTIAWASAQMGLLQVLKAIHIGGKPVLNSPGLVWLANGILGVIGMTIAATQAGVPLVAAIIQAVIAVFAASGEYEFFSKTQSAGRPTGSESEEAGPM